MSDLTQHLRSSGITQAQFASRIGVDQATISKLCRGKLTPSLQLAVIIERETGSEVKASSWVPDGTKHQTEHKGVI